MSASLVDLNAQFVLLHNQISSLRAQIGQLREVTRGYAEQRDSIMADLYGNRQSPGSVPGFDENQAWLAVAALSNLIQVQRVNTRALIDEITARRLQQAIVKSAMAHLVTAASIEQPEPPAEGFDVRKVLPTDVLELEGINVAGDVVVMGVATRAHPF